ncbi:MAG: hypothetical protein ACLUFH_00410 [Monoglobales bacterium]
MTENEKRFQERELEILLRKLQRNREHVPRMKLKTAYRKSYEALLEEIRDKAQKYIREVVFSGMGGYYLISEVPMLQHDLNLTVNDQNVRKELSRAIFTDSDIEAVKEQTGQLRNQVEQIIWKYQSHVGRGEKNET